MTIYHQLVAFAVAFIWGTNFVLIRYALDEMDSFSLAALRFLLVAIPLIFILPKPDVRWRYLLSYGLLIGVGQFGLLFWAMQENITPGLASLIIQLQVFFTVLLSVVKLGETITKIQLVALTLSFCGLGLIFLATGGHTTFVGLIVVLVAAFSWASGNLVVKQVGKVDTFAFLAWSSLFAVPPLAIMAGLTKSPTLIAESIVNLSALGWASVLWQSIGNTLIGYGLWNILLNRYSAATVTPWALLVPVFGMSASWYLLDETMPWWKLLAMVLIVAGLALNSISYKRLS